MRTGVWGEGVDYDGNNDDFSMQQNYKSSLKSARLADVALTLPAQQNYFSGLSLQSRDTYYKSYMLTIKQLSFALIK